MRYESAPVAPEERQETTRERAARQGRERQEELRSTASEEKRWAENRERVLAERKAVQQAYDLTEKEWNDDLQKQAKEYQWDTSQQENVSIAVLTVEEGNEYLDLLIKDSHGQLSNGKDYTGVGMGLKGAYEVAKELGGWGATAKAVNINGVMNIVVENYKPQYLDLGIRWQEATPQMLKIGHALNTVQGNVRFLKGNIYVELVFSGAVNAVDYILHDEKTLGEVVGQFTADISKGIAAGVIAQGITILGVATLSTVLVVPTALTLGIFAVSAFIVGKEISKLDDQFKFTEPMKNQVEKTINDF
ncbi:cell envelope integrity protein TolA [Vibrio parahaemolyticus]|nr:cell envelope integrity protein TolA [Vibrio parahaemolyticus]EHK9580763.1 cell envelope integrity protein TolA [Vibrio parahaemolyticus]EIZ1896869.1 cell envelope integrity protein TolA [Vibrio parahaemolyticus]EKO5154914.1 cell envelope integrity protein TolA [Vibrio parahaemolyticus]